MIHYLISELSARKRKIYNSLIIKLSKRLKRLEQQFPLWLFYGGVAAKSR